MIRRSISQLCTAAALIVAGCAAQWTPADQERLSGLETRETPPPSPAHAEETQERPPVPGTGDALVVATTDLTTDGRNMKIRGRVTNPFAEEVVGVRYRVSIYLSGSLRLLDAFIEERDDTVIAAGETGALRVDVATMYAAGNCRFLVEAYPIRLGAREIPEPAHWQE